MKVLIEKKRKHCSEFLIALYYNSFIILKPILNTFIHHSSLILMIVTCLIFISYLLCNRGRFHKHNLICFLGLFIFIFTIFIFDFIFRRNEYTWERYYQFLVAGALLSFLLINIRNYRKLAEYWCYLSIIGGVELFLDPFYNYRWTGEYMQFGNSVMLPAFAASVLLTTYFKKRYYSFFSLAFFINLIICGNKGAILTALAIIVFGVVYFNNECRFNKHLFLILIAVACLSYFMISYIIDVLISITDKLDFYSYALVSLKQILQGKGANIFNVRLDIWKFAWTSFTNNWLFGMGIGGLESISNNYAHNFVLDILVSHGIIIGLFILVIITLFIIKIFKDNNSDKRAFGVLILLLWIIPLMISFTFWKVMAFWFFIAINIMVVSSNNSRKIYIMNH